MFAPVEHKREPRAKTPEERLERRIKKIQQSYLKTAEALTNPPLCRTINPNDDEIVASER